MKPFHNIKVSVFAYPEEGISQIEKTLLGLFPFDLEKEKIILNAQNATGFNEKKITILEVHIEKERHTKAFLNSLLQNLSNEDKQTILKQASSRLDPELKFFIRLDKDKLIKEKTYSLTDSGNCFHIRMSVAAFPKDRISAMKVVKQIFA